MSGWRCGKIVIADARLSRLVVAGVSQLVKVDGHGGHVSFRLHALVGLATSPVSGRIGWFAACREHGVEHACLSEGKRGKPMNKQEAIELLHAALAAYRRMSYSALASRVGTGENLELKGPSGADYQIEVQFFWDSERGGPVRVVGSIDDGGWRAFFPLGEDFLATADGAFS
jgi:hypothetical protein